MTATGIDSEVEFYARSGTPEGALEEMRRSWCSTILCATSGASGEEFSTDDLMVFALQIITSRPDIFNVDDLWETMSTGDQAVVDIRESYYNTH